MMDTREIGTLSELAAHKRSSELLRHVPKNPFAEGLDAHLVLTNIDGEVVACCSLWWRACPALAGEATAAIGHFYALEEAAGRRVLEDACRRLVERGTQVAIGPMNGSTWRKYRFVTGDGDEPAFALEPENPEWWPRLWSEAGFSPLAGYHSSVVTKLAEADVRRERVEQRLSNAGIRIRELDKNRFAEELRGIYSVSRASFVDNFLYTPLEEEAFCRMYQPFKDAVDTRFALIAEEAGQAVGFVFSIPDFVEAARTGRSRTLIIKTLAVRPGRAYAGLGVVLVDRMREAAQQAGLERVIHALMFDGNNSANIGKKTAILRRYTLYRRNLSK